MVTATGIGPTKKEAELAAQRNAIEKDIGSFVDSETVTKNFMLIKDKILSKSRGYIKSFETISSQKQSDGNWEVKIKAEVAKGDLKNDLDALGILREKMGNPRIIVVLDTAPNNTINNPDNFIAKATYDGIIETLTEKEFPVVDEKISKQFMYRKFSSSEQVLREASKFGLNNQAEYVLIYDILPSEESKTSVFHKSRLIVSGKLINTSTANIYASDRQKTIGVDKDSIQFAKSKSGTKGGKLLARSLTNKLITRWESETVSGRPIIVEIRNINDFASLIEFKAELEKAHGVKNINQRSSTSTSVQYEVVFAGKISTLKKNVFKIFRSMNYEITPPKSGGDRITVDLSKTEEPSEDEEDTDKEYDVEDSEEEYLEK
jgi:hypothetical protein